MTRIVDGGWWEGMCNDRSGWFPGNYVEIATGMYVKVTRSYYIVISCKVTQHQSLIVLASIIIHTVIRDH